MKNKPNKKINPIYSNQLLLTYFTNLSDTHKEINTKKYYIFLYKQKQSKSCHQIGNLA